MKRGSDIVFPENKHSVKKILFTKIASSITSSTHTHYSSSRSSSTISTTMPKTLISVDPKKEPWNQDTPLHNRWHPDIVSLSIIVNCVHKICTKISFATCSICSLMCTILDLLTHPSWIPSPTILTSIIILQTYVQPAVAKVSEGEKFRVECVDWTGGQIKDNDSSDDVKNVDLSQVHYLSGPIEVDGAMPGGFSTLELWKTMSGDSLEHLHRYVYCNV